MSGPGAPARRFLFVLRSQPDVDHMAPLAWKCLEKGDRVCLVFDKPYAIEEDYRVRFLGEFPGLELADWPLLRARWKISEVLGRPLRNYYALKAFLRRREISACLVEWGEGLPPSRPGPLGFLRERFLHQFRDQLLAAARGAGVPAVCLPHGLNTKLDWDSNPHIREVLAGHGGKLPFASRSGFDAYVFTSQGHRRIFVEHGDLDPAVGQAWGSLRFSPQWLAVLDRIGPLPRLPPKPPGGVRLAFFIPKWFNYVDKPAVVSLLGELARRPDVQLLLKPHPRKGAGEADDPALAALFERPNVVLVARAESTALVRLSDAVIDIGSGMAVEAVVRRKPFIYPAYLHKNRLVFDEWGGCLKAGSAREVHQALERAAALGPSAVPEEESRKIERELVYAGQDPYDVPEYYYRRLLEVLARSRARTS